ncbi:MAG TPA: flagellar hook assembly protein FlgD [Saliniramus sp.]|nr:flagellar hook assembly protein FlgD [Saliniramus sp.]
MQVNPVAPTTGPAATATAKNAMDYDAFLKLLVAEMKNQDPLSPKDSSEFVAQFAAFSQVEQGIKTNQKLDELLAASSFAQTGSLIGRNVVSGDGSVSGEIKSVKMTAEGAYAQLLDGQSLLIGPGVTIS